MPQTCEQCNKEIHEGERYRPTGSGFAHMDGCPKGRRPKRKYQLIERNPLDDLPEEEQRALNQAFLMQFETNTQKEKEK